MRKLFIPLTLIIMIAFGCSQQPEPRFAVSPEKPGVGQEITVAYNPAATPLENAEDVAMLAYQYSSENMPRLQEVEMTKSGKSWQGSFTPDSSILLILVKFQSGDKSDINDPDGYTILFHNETGDTLPGVHAALARAYFYGAFPLRLKRNADRALEMIEKEFALYPDQKEQNLGLYWNILLRVDKQNGKNRVLAEVDSLASLEKLSLENKNLLVSFYSRLGQPEKAEPLKEAIRKQDPKGGLVQSERFREFRQAKGLYKLLGLYNQFKVDFPDNANLPYMGSKIVNEFTKLKRYDEAERFLETSAFKVSADHYNSLAWAMVEKEINLKTAAQIAKIGVDLAREAMNAPIEDKPSYLSEKEWRDRKKYSLGMVLDTYATALYKSGEIKQAIPAFEEAVESTGKAQNDINERYANALIEAGENEKALQFVEGLIKEGSAGPAFKELFKKAYIAAKGSEQGLEAALTELNQAGLKKVKDELTAKLIEKPAPDFSLADLQGNTVSLADLTGKTLVLDFWATWCGPCIASFPGMQKAVEKFQNDESVAFLFINTWERGQGIEKKVADFIEQNNYPFHVLMDSESKVVEKYGVEGIPTKFVVDKKGNIRFKSVGFSGDADKLVEELSIVIDLVK